MIKKTLQKEKQKSTVQNLHFKVHSNLYNNTVRDAYWFEGGRQKWALDVLRCLKGITFVQEVNFLMGDSIFINGKDDTIVLVKRKDKVFKKRLKDFLFGDGKMKVSKDKLERANFSGWLTTHGFFIKCRAGEHIPIAEMICDKLKLIKGEHTKNYELMLELDGAIKITNGTVLYGSSDLISDSQIEILSEYIDNGGELNTGERSKKITKKELLDWLGKDT